MLLTDIHTEYTHHFSWQDVRLEWADLAPDIPVLEGEDWLTDRLWIPNIFIENERSSQVGCCYHHFTRDIIAGDDRQPVI